MLHQRIVKLILFFLCTTIKNAASVCKIPMLPDTLGIYEIDGPLIYAYGQDGVPAFRHPSPDSSCIFDSLDDRLHLTCPGDGSTIEFYQKVGTNVRVQKTTSNTAYLYDDEANARGVRVHGAGGPKTFVPVSGNYVKCLANLTASLEMETTTRTALSEDHAVGYRLNEAEILKVYAQEFYRDDWVVTRAKVIPVLSRRPAFADHNAYQEGPHFRKVKINFAEVYSKEHQQATFQKRFNNVLMTEKYFAGNRSLVAGQLIFEEDMFYYAEQISTRFYENTAPIWDSVYEGNWRTVGSAIRRMADETARDLDVFVLADPSFLFNRSPGNWELGRTAESPGNLPVPRVLVKAAVYADNPAEGVVFHTFNDPHLDVTMESSHLHKYCSVVHNDCSAMHPEFNDADKGFTFCCSPKDSTIFNTVFARK